MKDLHEILNRKMSYLFLPSHTRCLSEAQRCPPPVWIFLASQGFGLFCPWLVWLKVALPYCIPLGHLELQLVKERDYFQKTSLREKWQWIFLLNSLCVVSFSAMLLCCWDLTFCVNQARYYSKIIRGHCHYAYSERLVIAHFTACYHCNSYIFVQMDKERRVKGWPSWNELFFRWPWSKWLTWPRDKNMKRGLSLKISLHFHQTVLSSLFQFIIAIIHSLYKSNVPPSNVSDVHNIKARSSERHLLCSLKAFCLFPDASISLSSESLPVPYIKHSSSVGLATVRFSGKRSFAKITQLASPSSLQHTA